MITVDGENLPEYWQEISILILVTKRKEISLFLHGIQYGYVALHLSLAVNVKVWCIMVFLKHQIAEML